MVNPQSSVQSTSLLDYEELLEEMEKLDIADLILIHRRVALKWAYSLEAALSKESQRIHKFKTTHLQTQLMTWDQNTNQYIYI